MKTIKYILLLLPFIGIGQIQIDSTRVELINPYKDQLIKFYKPTKKEFQYKYVYSTIYLMDLYMEETKNDSIQVYGRNGMSMWFTEPAPKTFIDFYEWTKKYFKDEKDSFRVVIEQ